MFFDPPEDLPPIMAFSSVGPPAFTLDDVTLIDDGTLDTVIRVKGTTLRFDSAREFRDEFTGALDLAAFVEFHTDYIGDMLDGSDGS